MTSGRASKMQSSVPIGQDTRYRCRSWSSSLAYDTWPAGSGKLATSAMPCTMESNLSGDELRSSLLTIELSILPCLASSEAAFIHARPELVSRCSVFQQQTVGEAYSNISRIGFQNVCFGFSQGSLDSSQGMDAVLMSQGLRVLKGTSCCACCAFRHLRGFLLFHTQKDMSESLGMLQQADLTWTTNW